MQAKWRYDASVVPRGGVVVDNIPEKAVLLLSRLLALMPKSSEATVNHLPVRVIVGRK